MNQLPEKYHENENITDCASEYSEPGYSTDKGLILFGDWNSFNKADLDELEEIAVLEWHDEWSICECGKAVRTSGDSYHWKPSYHIIDGCGLLCIECIDPEEYLEDMVNDPTKAITLNIDPKEYGYKLIEGDFQNGFHPGQDDNPINIYKRLESAYASLVFLITDVGQFDMSFEVYGKENGS